MASSSALYRDAPLTFFVHFLKITQFFELLAIQFFLSLLNLLLLKSTLRYEVLNEMCVA